MAYFAPGDDYRPDAELHQSLSIMPRKPGRNYLRGSGGMASRVPAKLACRQPSGKHEHGNSQSDPINGEGHEPTAAHPGHKPRHRSVAHDEGHNKTDAQQDPLMRVELRNADGIFTLTAKRFQKSVAGGDNHRRNRQKKRKFQRR